MSDPRIVTLRPEAGDCAWTFGGAPPVVRIAPGTVRDLFTKGCFTGRVRSEKDLVSEAYAFPCLNPRTPPPADVCDTDCICVAKLRMEGLRAGETHPGPYAKLRGTATAPRG